MTTKRKTKVQKEAEEKAALKQRLTDIYSGALGDKWDDDGLLIAYGELLCKVVMACRSIFETEDNKYLFEIHNLDKYETAGQLTEFYYRNGVRA